MKVSLISNFNIGYLKENKQISNTSNSKFERNITAPSFKAGIIKHGLIVSCFFLPLGCFTTSCNSDKSQNTPTEQVEIPNGRLVNRSDAEIENITGLNPIQFEVAKQLLLDEVNYVFSKRWGQMYFKDTEYCRDIKNIFGHSFYMNFTNGIDELKILGKSGKNYYGFYWPVPGGYDFRPKIRVIQEPDGNFTIITSIKIIR